MGAMLHLNPVVFSGLGYLFLSCCSEGIDGANGFRVLRYFVSASLMMSAGSAMLMFVLSV